jgi:signal transduction protein with GAF and PtsI domain
VVNVEFAHILWRQLNVSSHLDIELKHLILLELDGSLYQLPTIDSHIDLVEHRSNDLFATDVG